MQEILIIGYLGRDPELKYSPQGAVIAQYFYRQYRALEGQERRIAGAHGVVRDQSFRASGGNRRRVPTQRQPYLSRRPQAH